MFSSSGGIIGVSVGAGVGLILVIIMCVFCVRKYCKKSSTDYARYEGDGDSDSNNSRPSLIQLPSIRMSTLAGYGRSKLAINISRDGKTFTATERQSESRASEFDYRYSESTL